MSGSARARWDAFWHAETAERNLAVARAVLAASALWVALSRVDLPSVLAYPPEMWSGVGAVRQARFLLGAPLAVERVLYGALHLALAAALFGVAPRVACFAGGLLLYHFAPMETLMTRANPYLRGFTLPALGLLLLAFAPSAGRFRDPEGRQPAPAWPLRLTQVLVCQMYFFAGYAKLLTSGLAWPTAANVRGYLLLLNQGLAVDPASTLGYALAEHPLACALLGGGGLAFELAFPLVLVSRGARRVLLPLAVLFHLGNALLFRIYFQNVFLLLLFVDWAALRRRA
jgi:hypothetical protein